MTHRDLVSSCLLELTLHGLFWSNNTGALRDANDRLVRYGLKGSSDILGLIAGRFVAVECKAGRDRQRKEQMAFERAVTNAGGVYILARSVDDVVERLVRERLIVPRKVAA